MKKSRLRLNYIVLVVSLLLVGVDQLIKYLAIRFLSPLETFPLWKDVLHLTYVENRGAAFGMFEGKTFWLVGLTGIIIIAMTLALVLNKVDAPAMMWAAGLIVGGGIGNLIDRVARGFVVDYIHVKIIQFAVFNFADCCVVIGTLLLVVYILFFDGKESKQKVAEPVAEDDENESEKQDEADGN